ncbi:MAG: hypothetical protein GKR88_15955 [Flavobacteriaceae bacterium]|nr:MAG: hypothetical protein GKR88_15955 [Flavobacteriaceae bacterium]
MQKKINELLQKSIIKKISDRNTITSIGVLSTETLSKNMDLQSLIAENFQTKNSCYLNYRTYDKKNEFSEKYFSENSFDWKGCVIDEDLKSFLGKEFDVLITVFDQKNLYLEYTTLKSEAIFKVGIANINDSLFDLEIQTDFSDIHIYLNEVKKYLQILSKTRTNL